MEAEIIQIRKTKGYCLSCKHITEFVKLVVKTDDKKHFTLVLCVHCLFKLIGDEVIV